MNNNISVIHFLEAEFVKICIEIIEQNKCQDEWALIESDDMFQAGKYEGGFDATESEFSFSVLINEKEHWFQMSLEDIKKVYEGLITEVQVTVPDK